MGYRRIPNLYKKQTAETILGLDEVYALEKLHGTSAHIGIVDGELKIFSGGVNHVNFVELLESKFGSLDELKNLIAKGMDDFPQALDSLIVYGEAYGGKCQKMADIYGPLNFCAFEVKVFPTGAEPYWLDVPSAELMAVNCGFDFVHYERGPAKLAWLDAQRDKPSVQAVRNGMGEGKYGEGIVIRALSESIRDKWGDRILAKHKSEKYKETRTPRKVDPEKTRLWTEARKVAEEFIVAERLRHVIDALIASGREVIDMTATGDVIRAMIQDVKVEEGDEIEWTKEVEKSIGSLTVKLFKKHLEEGIK